MSLKIEHAHLVLPYQVLQDAWLISREGKSQHMGAAFRRSKRFLLWSTQKDSISRRAL